MYEIKRFGKIKNKNVYFLDLWDNDDKLNLEIHIPFVFKQINHKFEWIIEKMCYDDVKVSLSELDLILNLIIQEKGD